MFEAAVLLESMELHALPVKHKLAALKAVCDACYETQRLVDLLERNAGGSPQFCLHCVTFDAIENHPLNPPYQPTLSTHPINPPYQPTPSTHSINSPDQPLFSIVSALLTSYD